MAALTLDASVLIGLLDAADGHHRQAVEEVDQADGAGTALLAPASAYSEALVAFARAGRTADARDAIAAMGITIVAMSQPIAECAAEIRARHDRLRLPDAIVLATARELDADLLTYDDRLRKLAADIRPHTLENRANSVGTTRGARANSPVITAAGACQETKAVLWPHSTQKATDEQP